MKDQLNMILREHEVAERFDNCESLDSAEIANFNTAMNRYH